MGSFLDDHDAGPLGDEGSPGRREALLARQGPGLLVVQDEEIETGDHLPEGVALDVDPEIHGVARHEGRLLDLIEHLHLQIRIDVGQKDELRPLEQSGQVGPKVLEDVQLRVQGLGHGAGPPRSVPDQRKLRPFSICRPVRSIPRAESLSLCASGKSSPTTPTRRTGAKRLAAREKWGGRTSEHVLTLARRRLQSVEPHRTDHQDFQRRTSPRPRGKLPNPPPESSVE